MGNCEENISSHSIMLEKVFVCSIVLPMRFTVFKINDVVSNDSLQFHTAILQIPCYFC